MYRRHDADGIKIKKQKISCQQNPKSAICLPNCATFSTAAESLPCEATAPATLQANLLSLMLTPMTLKKSSKKANGPQQFNLSARASQLSSQFTNPPNPGAAGNPRFFTMKKHRKQTKDELDRLFYSSITFIGCMLGMIALTVIAKLAGY